MRRLLRGERPDVFLASGRRLTVCELCAPRAAHEGWLRESQQVDSLELSPARPRRGRGLLARLRGRTDLAEPAPDVAAVAAVSGPTMSEPTVSEPAVSEAPVSRSVMSESAVFGPIVSEPVGPGSILMHSDETQSDDDERVASETVSDEPVPDANRQTAESEEAGSWRDAWMFVTE